MAAKLVESLDNFTISFLPLICYHVYMNNRELAVFDDIKHSNEEIDEFWSARELYKVLGYSSWRRFLNVIEKAKISFKQSEFTKNYNINDHFYQVVKMIPTGKGAERPVEDYQLSKYACYLAFVTL